MTPSLRGELVLVTGGAGFIGSHLVERLVEVGARVTVLDDLSSGDQAHLAAVAEEILLVRGDIRDVELVSKLCRGVRVVFHQAAVGSVPRSLVDPLTTFDHNVGGSSAVLEAARRAGVERVVYASSASVYGDAEAAVRREGEEGQALSPYALSKQQGEAVAALYGRCYGLATVGLRYFNVYGPRQRRDGDYAAVVPNFLAAALAGRPLEIHGDGGQSRDFLFVRDAVEANLLAAEAVLPERATVVNVGAGEVTTVLALAQAVQAATGSQVPIVHGPARAGDIRHAGADLARARAVLGYQPRWTLASGLAVTVEASLVGSTGGPR
jgi:UDP-N-acetylglucosamine 4-epimerase